MIGAPMHNQQKGLLHRGILRVAARNNPELHQLSRKTPYVLRHPIKWLLFWPVRKTAKVGFRAWLKSFAWMRRSHAGAPFAAAWWIWLLATVAHLVPRAWLTALAVCLLAGPFVYRAAGLPLGRFTHCVETRVRYQVGYLGAYAAASLIAVYGAAVGTIGTHRPAPILLILWAVLAGWAVHWWGAPEEPVVEDQREEILDSEEIQMWKQHLAIEGGPLAHAQVSSLEPVKRILPGSTVPTTIGWRVTGAYTRGKGKTSVALTKVEDVAAVYDTELENVAIEGMPGQGRRKFRVTVFTDNPLRQTWHWPGPRIFDYETGIAPIGMYADIEQALYRFYRRGSGPVHDLIAGTTDAGKSRLVDLLLSYERDCPFIASVVIDPQQGQSLPAWKSRKDGTHRTAGFATNLLEGRLVLHVLRDEMYARNAYLASIGWTDEDGNDEEGVDSFDPLSGPTAGIDQVDLTIEEAHAILADPEMKKIVEDIAKMARKCGIKLRLVVQVPLLDQLGGSTTLRDMVAAGNVIVLRTANALSGAVAFNGNLPVDPKTLPREWAVVDDDGVTSYVTTSGLGYVLGPGARSVPARMFFTSDVRARARAGETTELKLLDPRYKGKTLNQLLEEFRAGTLTLDAMPGMAAPAAGAPTVATRVIPADGTAWDKIAAFLDGRRLGAPTGMIAHETGLKLPTVSTTLGRAADDGKAHKLPSGWWQLGGDPAAPMNGREHVGVGS